MKLRQMAFLTAFALVLGVPVVQGQTDTQSPDAKQMPQMQERMKKMQEQMNRIHQAKDPAERQKLMHEHMQTMREQMKDMHAMGGGMKMGKKDEHGGPSEHSGPCHADKDHDDGEKHN